MYTDPLARTTVYVQETSERGERKRERERESKHDDGITCLSVDRMYAVT